MFQIENPEAFRTAVSEARRFCSTRSTVEAQYCILIEIHDGFVSVSAHDGYKTYVWNGKQGGDFDALLNGPKLCDLLMSMKKGDLFLGQNGSEILIECGNTKVSLPSREISECTRSIETDGTKVTLNSHELSRMLSLLMPISKVDGANSGERAVQFVPAYGLLATDSIVGTKPSASVVGHLKTDLFESVNQNRVCVKTECVAIVNSLLKKEGSEDTCDVIFCESHTTFVMSSCSICMRSLEDFAVGYVPTPYLLRDKGWTTEIAVVPGEISEAMKIMTIIAPPESRTVVLRKASDGLMLKQSATSLGKSDHVVSCTGVIEGEVSVDMDKLRIAMECWRGVGHITARYNELGIGFEYEGYEILLAGLS